MMPILPLAPVILAHNPQIPLCADDCGVSGDIMNRPMWVAGTAPISRQTFLQDVAWVSQQLPDSPRAFNLCEDRYCFLVGFCAALLKGTVNLLPPAKQPAVLGRIAAGHAPVYCITDGDLETDLPQVNLRALLPAAGTLAGVTGSFEIPAQQLAALVFTSGSTGQPKAQAKPWGTLAGTARLLARRFTLDLPAPAIVATVPTQHMYGLEMTALQTLQGGATLHAARPFFPADIQAALEALEADRVLVTTPVHLRALLGAGIPLPPLAGIVSATAPLAIDLATAAEARFRTRVQEIYGCTEAGSIATRMPTRGQNWTLLPGFILEQTGSATTAHAPHLAEPAPLHDEIAIEASGHFRLLGRHADMINVAGKRASLADLTLQLQAIDGVLDGVFFMPKAAANTGRPAALVVSDLPARTILSQLSRHLDAAFLPRPLYRVERLPRNDTGKLTQAALDDLWNQLHG